MLKDVILEDVSFCQRYSIACPVKMSSIRRWMEDLKFKHCPQKKSCVINMHEREDVKEDCKQHVAMFKKKRNRGTMLDAISEVEVPYDFTR